MAAAPRYKPMAAAPRYKPTFQYKNQGRTSNIQNIIEVDITTCGSVLGVSANSCILEVSKQTCQHCYKIIIATSHQNITLRPSNSCDVYPGQFTL
jgi:hypothetical protein